MQLTERHIIERSDPRYAAIDKAAFASKNLYNATLYIVRQIFIGEGEYLNYNTMDQVMQKHEAYRGLPTKVAQAVVKQVHEAWISFFEACKEYREHPEKFKARPKLPGYKDKVEGRNLLIYNMQAVSRGKRTLDRGRVLPSQLAIEVKTKQDPKRIDQVRIVPRKGHYVVEIVYERKEKEQTKGKYIAGVDLGINNLLALTSDKPGFQAVVVNGRPIKSVNQYYNKRRAELQSALRRRGTSKRMERMTNKRTRRLDHYMHTASKQVVDLLVREGIGTLVIGKNDGWKNGVKMGKRNNQSFTQIPHARFISYLKYKAELVGIEVKVTEESYTSKASLLDLDKIPVYNPKRKEKPRFSGKRIKRGLYRASDGRLINADINGAGNIIRKVAPKAFGSRVVEDGKARFSHALVVHPVRLVVTPSQNQIGKSRARVISRYKSL
jgi:IS605 OrfB family transposase